MKDVIGDTDGSYLDWEVEGAAFKQRAKVQAEISEDKHSRWWEQDT